MTINREHLAGLELALAEIPVYGESADRIRALIAKAQAAPEAEPVALSVWYGPMPESNGKSNYTAILHRRGECMSEGITIDRGEYPDRVRYEADCMRFLIGELADEPDILDYDAEAHSGYTAPQHDAELVELLRASVGLIRRGDFDTGYCCCGGQVDRHGMGDGHSPVDEGGYCASQLAERIDAKLATLRHV